MDVFCFNYRLAPEHPWPAALEDAIVRGLEVRAEDRFQTMDAFREAGLRVGFYYSLIDWHHPDFTIDLHHPRRDDPDAFEQNQGRDMKRYAQYMRDQLTELLTNYGKIDILWLDFSYSDLNGTGDRAWMKGKGKDDWESEKLIATVRSLQPDIIIDNRSEIDQDIWTPEQYQPMQWVTHPETGELVTWEACQTFSGSWGYFRDEQTWKSPEMLIRMLVNTVSIGGNLLMNVGPTARGYLDYRAEEALQVYADWMKYNSRSIYGCTMAEPGLVAPPDCRYTQSEDGRRLYLHLFAYPFAHVQLPGLAGNAHGVLALLIGPGQLTQVFRLAGDAVVHAHAQRALVVAHTGQQGNAHGDGAHVQLLVVDHLQRLQDFRGSDHGALSLLNLVHRFEDFAALNANLHVQPFPFVRQRLVQPVEIAMLPLTTFWLFLLTRPSSSS